MDNARRLCCTALLWALASTPALLGTHVAAASEDDATVTVHTTRELHDWWDTVHTTIRWCRPRIAAGDGFRVALPDDLASFRPEFTVSGSDGTTVADGVVVDDRELRVDVTGAAGTDMCVVVRLESQFADGEKVAGRTIALRYSVGGATHVNHVQVRAWTGLSRTAPNAWGEFRLPHDQCRTLPASCITWHFDTAAGPRPPARLTYRPEHGQRNTCRFVHVDLVRLDARRRVRDLAPLTVRVDCRPGRLYVDLPELGARTMARVSVPVTVTAPFPEGGVDFGATASFRTGAAEQTASDLVHSNTAVGRTEPGDAPARAEQPEERRGQGWWPLALLAGGLGAAGTAAWVRRRR